MHPWRHLPPSRRSVPSRRQVLRLPWRCHPGAEPSLHAAATARHHHAVALNSDRPSPPPGHSLPHPQQSWYFHQGAKMAFFNISSTMTL